MLIKQLSIFLENKKGRFTEVAKILGEAGVNMSAFTVAENSDFGILRLIVSIRRKRYPCLREKAYTPCKRGRRCLSTLSPTSREHWLKRWTSLLRPEYLLSICTLFSQGDAANVIIRPDNVEKCAEVLESQ